MYIKYVYNNIFTAKAYYLIQYQSQSRKHHSAIDIIAAEDVHHSARVEKPASKQDRSTILIQNDNVLRG